MASRFSQTFSADVPPNFRLLPAFPCQDLMPDGVFLDPVSGLHYVLHVFDQADLILSQSSLGGEAQFAQVRENVRHHDDRMAFIESRHNQLQLQADCKAASDAEFNDWMLNRSEEDWFTVKGLPRLTQVAPSEWQDAARHQVSDLIKHVLNINRVRLDFTVLLVINPFRHLTSGPTTYNVRMNSVAVSSRIRDIFSGFFRHNRPVKLPQDLKGVSLRNKITKETKIRIEIMRAMAEIYKASNPGSSYHLRGYDSRPLLAIYPPQNSGGRQRTFNFIQAARNLSHRFSDDHLIQIYQVVGNSCMGQLRSLFIVLNDDDRDRCAGLVAQSRGSGRSRGRRGNPGPSQPSASSGSSASVHFAQVQGQGSGASLEAGFLKSLRSEPPPPPPSDWTQEVSDTAVRTRVRSKSRSRSRSVSSLRTRKGSKRSKSRSRSGSRDTKKRSRSRSVSSHGTRKGSKRSRSRSRSGSRDTKKRSRRSRSRSSSSPESKKRSKKSKHSKRRRTPSSASSSGSSRSSHSPSPRRKKDKSKGKDTKSKK